MEKVTWAGTEVSLDNGQQRLAEPDVVNKPLNQFGCFQSPDLQLLRLEAADLRGTDKPPTACCPYFWPPESVCIINGYFTIEFWGVFFYTAIVTKIALYL